MASLADFLHDHCLDAGCIGFSEDGDVGAMVFPPDVKHLSEATLVECIQGLQVTSIINPSLTPV